MLQSLDAVMPGDYLVCTRGALKPKKRTFDKPDYDEKIEGLLVRVLAVSPPMMLARYYPFPNSDAAYETGVMSYTWGRMGWSKATKTYVKEYLKAGGYRPDGTRRELPVKEKSLPLPMKFKRADLGLDEEDEDEA